MPRSSLAKAHVTGDEQVERAGDGILTEPEGRVLDLRTNEKLVEAHRLETRTK